MNRSDLIAAIANRHNLSITEATGVVSTIFDAVADTLSGGGRVELRGFGSFSTKTHSPRMGRNPKTGEEVAIPERRSVAFKAGKELRERVDGGQS
ncbi:MAG: integration host factor subunit beta [Magnetococcales bacterium]|nr:integration host factor subunit beta [Magnetococcales bacterium]